MHEWRNKLFNGTIKEGYGLMSGKIMLKLPRSCRKSVLKIVKESNKYFELKGVLR